VTESLPNILLSSMAAKIASSFSFCNISSFSSIVSLTTKREI